MPDQRLFAPLAFLPEGWARDVRVTLRDGRIDEVDTGALAGPEDLVLGGRALLPAAANLHSHSFQRAMAGMTEIRGPGADSFWTWRRQMYAFLDVLAPEHVEAIAAFAFMEMLEAGFGSVAEFHYLHHRPGGAAYAHAPELAERIVAAARTAGIGLTLLPVLYSHGGARAEALAGGQLRFGATLDRYLALCGACDLGGQADTVLGTAAHSLRAVTPDALKALAVACPSGPMHLHAAEQVGEVEEITGWLGAPPVRYLLDEIGMGARWCVIHATHMRADETEDLARSGTVAGLCPVTEANLGDGIFDGARHQAAEGRFGVGTDSNIAIDLAGELRQLEYAQRLGARARNVLAAPGGSVGETIFGRACAGGAQALGRATGAIAAGCWGDLVTLDRGHPTLIGLSDDRILDGWIFAGARAVREVWSAGRPVVRDGVHVARPAIEAGWRRAMTELRDRV